MTDPVPSKEWEGPREGQAYVLWLEGQVTELRKQVEELSIHAEKWVKRALGGATPEPPAEWQPIETAPKDREVLGWFPYYATQQAGGSVWVIRWREDQYSKNPKPYFEASGWVWGIRDQRAKQPTHWMPLPTRPSQPPRDGQ